MNLNIPTFFLIDLLKFLIKKVKFLLLIFLGLITLVIIDMVFIHPQKCPSDYYEYRIKPKSINGIIIEKSLTCEKNIIYLKYIEGSDTINLDIDRSLLCLVNKIEIGDSIIKKENKLQFIVCKKNGQTMSSGVECNLNKCDCENGTSR